LSNVAAVDKLLPAVADRLFATPREALGVFLCPAAAPRAGVAARVLLILCLWYYRPRWES